MKIMMAGGTGLIGSALVNRWRDSHQLTVLSRKPSKVHHLFGEKVQALDWQQFNKDAATCLQDYDVVLNLCGANIGSKRWSNTRKREILQSRVETTACLAQACASLQSQAPRLLNASAIGIYGIHRQAYEYLPSALDEAADVASADDSFLARVGCAWEQALQTAEEAGVAVVRLRFAVVLSSDGGALVRMMLPFRLGFGGVIGTGTQILSWVSIEDVCRAIEFILAKPELQGAVNIVAPQAVSQEEFAHTLADVLRRPCAVPMPSFLLRFVFGQMAEELLLSGQHIVPSRLLHAGFQFHHPHLRDAFDHLLAT